MIIFQKDGNMKIPNGWGGEDREDMLVLMNMRVCMGIGVGVFVLLFFIKM